jgi:hypothetical protein
MTQPFFQQVVRDLVQQWGRTPDGWTLVVPGRRARLFLRLALEEELRPAVYIEPEILTLEEWFERTSGLEKISGPALQIRLFQTAAALGVPGSEDLEAFQRWGPLLLSDINDLDQAVASWPDFFSNLLDVKILEQWYPDAEPGKMGTDFLAFWGQLKPLAEQFRAQLLEEGLAYSGLLTRRVAEAAQAGALPVVQHLAWIGMGAMTPAERITLEHLVKLGHIRTYWDVQPTALERVPEVAAALQPLMHAGGKQPLQLNLSDGWQQPKQVVIDQAPNAAVLAQRAAAWVEERLARGIRPEDMAIVLAREGLLVPVLNALPATLGAVNITMGYPLRSSNWASLLQVWMEFFDGAEPSGADAKVYFRRLENAIAHPLMGHLIPPEQREHLLQQLHRGNIVFPGFQWINRQLDQQFTWLMGVHALQPAGMLESLHILLRQFKLRAWAQLNAFDREVLYQVTTQLEDMAQLLAPVMHQMRIKTLVAFVRRHINQAELTLAGEPLEGLQIMGLLETRALALKHICMLPVNEGILPASGYRPTLIPHDLRRHFGLSMPAEREVVFAYHFYRLLGHAEDVTLMYDTSSDGFNRGEMSRFIQQLRYEWPDVQPAFVPARPFVTLDPQPRMVPKTPDVMEAIHVFLQRGMSPSALNAYLRNPYQFYRSYLLGEGDAEEVEEHADARVVGNVIHRALEAVLSPWLGKTLDAAAYAAMMNAAAIEQHLHKAFAAEGYPDLSQGYNHLLLETAQAVVVRNLKREAQDAAQEHWMLFGLEHNLVAPFQRVPGVNLKGRIDRIDVRNGKWYILDYKTGYLNSGNIKLNPGKMEVAEFQDDKMVQLALYTWLATHALEPQPELSGIQAGLINLRSPSNHLIALSDVNPEAMAGVEDQVERVVRELLNPEIPILERVIDASFRSY